MHNVNLKNPLDEIKGIKESTWLKSIHQKNLVELKNSSFPSKKDEDWKHTDPNAFFSSDYFVSHSPSPLSMEQLSLLENIKKPADFLNLVFIDGYYSPEFSDPLSADSFKNDGWAFFSFKEIKNDLDLNPYQLNKKLSVLLNEFKNESVLESLNGRYFQDGGFFVFAPSASPQKTIHIIDITTQSNLIVSPRYFFYASANSEVSLAHTVLSKGDYSYLHNGVWDFHLEENAHVKWLINSNQNQEGKFVGTIRVKQKKDSQFSAWQVTRGSGLERFNWNIDLAGVGARCDLKGVYALKEKRHIDNTLKIHHRVQHTKSSQLFKGIVSDGSKAVFNGLVHVGKGASGSESNQLNKNILLDSQSRVDTRPQLIIENDDVKCTHGTTVGQMEEEELFYLQSRGLSPRVAFDMLTHAFLAECLLGLPASLKTLSVATLETYFKTASVIKELPYDN